MTASAIDVVSHAHEMGYWNTDWLSKRPTSSSYSSALVTRLTGSDFRDFGADFLTYLGATGASSTKSWSLDSSSLWLEPESCLLSVDVLRCLLLPVGSAPGMVRLRILGLVLEKRRK